MSDLHLTLPHDTASAALARREIRRFSSEHNFDETEALLIVTELVTNAVLHGAHPVWLHAIYRIRLVRFEVFDSDPDIARVTVQSLDDERVGGRGLHIVQSLTDRWGTTQHTNGKTVWAELDLAESG